MAMTKTIMVVDDNKQLRKLIDTYLSQEGYRVVSAANGQEALYVSRQEKPNLIILDLMMPEMGGYDFLHAHNKEAETPVIILTAKVEENEKVLGLELGADDYVTKPFSMRELTARVRAVLRRSEKAAVKEEVIQASGILLNRTSREVLIEGKSLDLTPSEFDLLAVLMTYPGRAYSRLELLEHLQGTTFEGYERTIDVHIRNLRSKIEPEPSKPQYVQTVYGIGYRFAANRQ
jgi:DNA-binding response OmpR family regulator